MKNREIYSLENCEICGKSASNLLTTPVVINNHGKQKERYTQMCQECIERLCDAGIGKWSSTWQDEMIRLPDRTFMRL